MIIIEQQSFARSIIRRKVCRIFILNHDPTIKIKINTVITIDVVVYFGNLYYKFAYYRKTT